MTAKTATKTPDVLAGEAKILQELATVSASNRRTRLASANAEARLRELEPESDRAYRDAVTEKDDGSAVVAVEQERSKLIAEKAQADRLQQGVVQATEIANRKLANYRRAHFAELVEAIDHEFGEPLAAKVATALAAVEDARQAWKAHAKAWNDRKLSDILEERFIARMDAEWNVPHPPRSKTNAACALSPFPFQIEESLSPTPPALDPEFTLYRAGQQMDATT